MSFGIAVTLGSTIGVGILRTPGTVAAQLGNVWLIMAIWTVGGVYALFGTIAVTELATALPQAGGWYVYARRAFGEYAGFTTALGLVALVVACFVFGGRNTSGGWRGQRCQLPQRLPQSLSL